MFPIDLHMHTNYSDDAEFTPATLVSLCHHAGIHTMAITDHNSIMAVKEAAPAAVALGIRYIPAIEIDCTYTNIDFHVIGYGVDPDSPDFAAIENNIAAQAERTSRERLALINRIGFQVTESDLYAVIENEHWKNNWTGEAFAEVLLAKPEYLTNELLLPYREGGNRGDNPFVNFYWDFCAQGKPCHVEMSFPSMEETIHIIHKNGGKAVLAHPGNNLKGQFQLLSSIIELGIDGIEVFSSYHDESVSRHFYNEARKHDLFVTCGSDFHGKNKPAIDLGASGCFLSEATLLQQLCF